MAAKNQSISRGECECKTIANQVKQDIDNLKARKVFFSIIS